jgi:hypothetical protein
VENWLFGFKFQPFMQKNVFYSKKYHNRKNSPKIGIITLAPGVQKLKMNRRRSYLPDLVVLGEAVVVEQVEHEGLVERLRVRKVLELERLEKRKL